jgi:hypothetical protein
MRYARLGLGVEEGGREARTDAGRVDDGAAENRRCGEREYTHTPYQQHGSQLLYARTTVRSERKLKQLVDATLRLCEPARRAVLGADRFRGRSC